MSVQQPNTMTVLYVYSLNVTGTTYKVCGMEDSISMCE